MDRYQKFYNQHEMYVKPAYQKIRRRVRGDYYWNLKSFESAQPYPVAGAVEEVDTVEILMPHDRLQQIVERVELAEMKADRVDRLQFALEQQKNQEEQDQQVRAKHPTVETAYQHYLMLLELCRH